MSALVAKLSGSLQLSLRSRLRQLPRLPQLPQLPLLPLLALLALGCRAGAGPRAESGQSPRAGGQGGPQVGEASSPHVLELAAAVEGRLEGARHRVPVYGDELRWGAPADAALVTIVVFSDYQCPYCAKLDATLVALASTYPNELRVVYKHFPLSMHGEARAAGLAVHAAQLQGRGEAMHALVFEADLRSVSLLELARRAQVPDLQRFEADLKGERGAEMIERDGELATSLGVSSTPSYFINGVAQRGAKPFEAVRAEVLAELESARAILDAGGAPAEVYPTLMALAVDGPAFERAERPSRKGPTGRPDPALRYAVPVDGRPAIGPANAAVTIVAFSDFQCPYCRKVTPTLEAVIARYGQDLRVVFRNNPLPMHARAKDAALAAMAADRQGAFWPMHDALFAAAEDGRLESANIFSTLAGELGLKRARFLADFGDAKTAKRVAEDMATAARFGAGGTPAFFVNGRFVSGAQPLEAFTAVIDGELAVALEFRRGYGGREELYVAMSQGWETQVEARPIAAHERVAIDLTGRPTRGQKAQEGGHAEPGSPIEILVCADFDCPFCARGAHAIDEVFAAAEYGGKVTFSYAHFPLPMHPAAEGAHRAAIAAGAQGKFWPMHDRLYADPERRGEDVYVEYARALNLDLAQFRQDLGSAETSATLAADKALCAGLGVSGTPHFFVNGRPLRGGVPFEMMRQVLDEELAGGYEAKVGGQ